MSETQSSICSWADATFGIPVSDASIAARALKEMAELVTACVNGEPAERIGVEIADVVIVLARLGRQCHMDVIATVAAARPDPDPCQSSAVHAAPAIDHLSCALTACELGDPGLARRALRDAAWHLADLAARVEIDLPAAIDAKMAINRARKWVLDGTGHGRHVPADGDKP